MFGFFLVTTCVCTFVLLPMGCFFFSDRADGLLGSSSSGLLAGCSSMEGSYAAASLVELFLSLFSVGASIGGRRTTVSVATGITLRTMSGCSFFVVGYLCSLLLCSSAST